MPELCEYERERQARIAANQARLTELGGNTFPPPAPRPTARSRSPLPVALLLVKHEKKAIKLLTSSVSSYKALVENVVATGLAADRKHIGGFEYEEPGSEETFCVGSDDSLEGFVCDGVEQLGQQATLPRLGLRLRIQEPPTKEPRRCKATCAANASVMLVEV